MRKAAFLALMVLAAGPVAWGQSNVLPPSSGKPALPDPHPIVVPQLTPGMATSAVAAVSPALAALPESRNGCSPINPCATVTPALQSASLPEPEAGKPASPSPSKSADTGAVSANGPCPSVPPAGAMRGGGRGGNGGAGRGGFGGRGEGRFAGRGEGGNAAAGGAGFAIHCPPAASGETGAASPQTRPAPNAAAATPDVQDRRSGRRGGRNFQSPGRDR